MYAQSNDERRSLDEAYLCATNASDLTLNPDRICAATHLIAAAVSGNRMGSALLHLVAEWSSADKPRKMTEAEIEARAKELPKNKGKPDIRRARTEALLGYATGMRHRAHRLIGWLPALSIMGEWAVSRGVDVDLLSPALYHFLNKTCPVCDGHGFRKLPDAPVLGKRCHHCEGSGEWPRPLGAQRVHDWLQGCIAKARMDRQSAIRA